MTKILWLDDETFSISYEKEILLPENLKEFEFEIIIFEMIDELLEYIIKKPIQEKDIFIIDIMLLNEEEIKIPNKQPIIIQNDLMAGATLYSEYLKKEFPNNKYILYTSREHEEHVFQNILNDADYGKKVFLIEKSQKDTKLLEILKKILKESSYDSANTSP